MLARNIIEKIENFAPQNLASQWDNPGFLCGNKDKDIKRVLLALDVDLNTIGEAIENKCDMIVSHHPMFFKGLKRIDFSEPEGKAVELLIKNDICVFSAHTNMDAAENGINQRLAELFELSDIKVLEPIDEKTGIGRIGTLKEEMTTEEFSKLLKEKLNTPFVKVSGEKNIKRLAICSGSGAEYFSLAKENGCDCLLTADVKYHNAIEAKENGICLIDAGHFPTEKLVCDIFKEILEDLPIELIISDDKDIFKVF